MKNSFLKNALSTFATKKEVLTKNFGVITSLGSIEGGIGAALGYKNCKKSLFFILIFSTSAFAQKDLKISQFGLSLQSENSAVGLDYGRKSSLTPGFMIDFGISPKTDVGVEMNLRRNYFGSESLLSHNYLSLSVLYKSKFKRFTYSIGPTVDKFVGVWEDKENTVKLLSSPRDQTLGLTARIEYKLCTFSKTYLLTPFVKINPQIINEQNFNLGLGIILSKMCKNGGKD